MAALALKTWEGKCLKGGVVSSQKGCSRRSRVRCFNDYGRKAVVLEILADHNVIIRAGCDEVWLEVLHMYKILAR